MSTEAVTPPEHGNASYGDGRPRGGNTEKSLATTLFDAETVRSMSKCNDTLAGVHVGLRVIMHALLIGVAYWSLEHKNWGLAAAAFIPNCIAWSFLGWAGIGHEFFHAKVFSNKTLNNFFFKLCSILTWSNFGYFAVTHPIHHRRTLMPEDPEGQPERGISKGDVFWGLTVDLPGFINRARILLLNSVNVVPGPLASTLFTRGSENRRQLVLGALSVLGFHMISIALFVSAGLYWLILLINFAPFFFSIFNRILAVAQHYGLSSEAHGMRGYLSNSRTVRLGPVLGFLYANMNFHVEHHIYPQIPFYNLERVHDRIREVTGARSSATGFLGIVRYLRRLGCFTS